MKKTRQILKIFVIIILIILVVYNQNTIINNFKEISINSNFDYENYNIKNNLSQNLNKDIQIEFCPSINCQNIYFNSFKNSKLEIKCAFYDLNDKILSKILLKKSKQNINVSLIIDNLYLKEKVLLKFSNSTIKIYSDINRKTKYNNYMHNKFCIIDKEIIISGSTNPTFNGFFKNNNNIIKINSKFLAKNYLNEFKQMSDGIFGTNKKSVLEYNNLKLKFKNETYKINSYFCPQNNCENEILKILNSSKKEILFASFVLTSKPIQNLLIKKSKQKINIIGLIENRNRNSKNSIYKIKNLPFKLILDKNKNNMHNKFFIIDEKYIITGSMNPSSSGNKYNDENILIIKNKKLALKYKNQFLKLIS